MKITFCSFFLLFTFFAHSQQEKIISINFNNKPLTEALSFLESVYPVHFSFQTEELKPYLVSLQIKEKNLNEILVLLTTETSLIFEVLSDNYIAIRQINKNDTLSICGTIYSNVKIPLSGATVSFNNSGFITNTNGYFEIPNVKADATIRIQYLGFFDKIYIAKDLFSKDCKTIILNEKSEEFETIFIKNYLTSGIDKKNDASFVISPKKLGIFPGLTEPDLFQSLQLLPGVNSPNETATGLHVRGGTPDQNLVIWDDIKIYHSGHLFGAFSPFNSYITESINFINKGTNAKYGDRISSVIDIRTNDSIQTKISAGAGFNLIAADAFFKLPIIKNKLSLIGSLRRSFTDIYQSSAYKETSDILFKSSQANTLLTTNNNFFFVDYNLKAILKINNNNLLTFSNLVLENKLDFGLEEIENSEGETEPISNGIFYNDFLETDNQGYSFNWLKKWNPNFEQTISGYYSDYYLIYNKFKTENDVRNLTFVKKNDVKDIGLSYLTTYKFNSTVSLKSGYQFTNKDVSYLFQITNDDNISIEDSNAQVLNTHAVYSSLEWNATKKINLNAGLRLNYYQNFDKFYIEPRLNISKYITPNFVINVTGEFKTQTLSQIDETSESGLSIENKLWSITNNKEFPIIIAEQFTLGFSYVKNKWHIDIDAYMKRIKGIVTLNFGFSDVFDNDAHIGESKVKGFDFYVKKEFKSYSTWLSYTFDDTQNVFDEVNDKAYFPGNSNIKHNFYWSHTYSWEKFDFALGWRWHSGKPYSKALSIVTNSSGNPALQTNGLNNYNLPNYNRLDFSSTYNFLLSKNKPIKAKIGISFLNVLNNSNVLSRDYYINKSTNTINFDDKISLERIGNLVFRVEF